MSKNSTDRRNRCGLLIGFTFVEVIVALAIASISLLALLRLHIISITMAEAAETNSQAVFLADEKMAEILACGYPQEGTYSGTVEKNALCFHWQVQVTDLRSTQLDKADPAVPGSDQTRLRQAGLRRVCVDVSWKQGAGFKHLQMSTYVADRKLP